MFKRLFNRGGDHNLTAAQVDSAPVHPNGPTFVASRPESSATQTAPTGTNGESMSATDPAGQDRQEAADVAEPAQENENPVGSSAHEANSSPLTDDPDRASTKSPAELEQEAVSDEPPSSATPDVPLLPAVEDEPAHQEEPEPADAGTEEQAAPQDVSAPLPPGALVAGRYLITGRLGKEQAAALLGGTVAVVDGDLYSVEDKRGYERCWSCGSTKNTEQQRFCADCGAPLQHQQVVLVRTGAATGEAEEFSEAGAFYHIVHPRKQFGSSGMAIEVGACSAEGPHHPNEDSYWTAVAGGGFDSKSEMFGVVALADGMGGYAPGSGLISKTIVTTVGRGVFGFLHDEPEAEVHEMQLQAMVRGAVAQANSRVLEEIAQHGEMGSTLVVGVIYGNYAYVANIGDSRAYYISPSGTISQITRDQSLIEQQIALGLLSPDAAYTAIGNNVILHAIGEEGVEGASDWYTQPLEPGSRLLLCSDGYWKAMRHDVWDPKEAAKQPTLRMLARVMVENAVARGSDDNTTVVLVGID